MNCWHCDRPAHGACVFCGRGVCKQHAKSMPSLVQVYRDKAGAMKAIVTENALHCGVCRPREDPVDLPELDGTRLTLFLARGDEGAEKKA
ncbi:MAG: hypothetical protein HY719_02905 [Planctomycetes bacterium]|nr:hypothetical protein [Planctomycetota bacterium]